MSKYNSEKIDTEYQEICQLYRELIIDEVKALTSVSDLKFILAYLRECDYKKSATKP